MTDSFHHSIEHPPEQQAIRDQCHRPSATFLEIPLGDIERSIPERFEKIVHMHPARVAVKTGNRSLTYAELNQYANGVAQTLIERRGVGNEFIAVLLEHGIDAVAAILGILKAGKAYVVLNDSFPKERNLFIAENCETPLIISDKRRVDLAAGLAADHRGLLNIDDIRQDAGQVTGFDLQPDTCASILYTSGSTGQPKGVVSTHRNILTSLRQHSHRLDITPDDRLTLLHSLSFGSALSHFFPSLLNGASLYPFDVKSQGVARLARWLVEEELTMFHSPPALFRELAELLSPGEKPRRLRFLRLSGAPITPHDFELYKNHFEPTTKLILGMGSSEARGICSAVVDHSFEFPKEGSPVGYAEAGKKITLLDENGYEVAPGEVGEMAVTSTNINRGYWKAPDQTAAKFSLARDGGEERQYRTGDLGKMLPDGFLIHLGRKDSMVKIRGFRVDLSEIERALSTHPMIKDVGVIDWDREPGQKCIAAYVVARQAGSLTAKELFPFLRSKLPDYMVPSVIKLINSLPLINGKLDRSGLPKPDHNRPELGEPFVQPRGEIEERLGRVWAEVLCVDGVGVHDNFFDLGGHSLAMSRTVARINKMFEMELPLKALFDAPTVAEMALVIGQYQAKQADEETLQRMLSEIEKLTEGEAAKELSGERAKGSSGYRHD